MTRHRAVVGERSRTSQGSEAGFTLVEALIAMVVLSFGLMAVTNLLLVASSSNFVANASTATTAEATEVMERLKAIPFLTLTVSTTADVLSVDGGNTIGCRETVQNCVVAGNFNASRSIQGVGNIKTRWQILRPGAGGTLYFVVRSEITGAMARQQTRAEFTTFRACSGAFGCPPGL